MRDRPNPSGVQPAVRRTTLSVDVVLLTPREAQLAVLLRRDPDAPARERWSLPWDGARGEETLEEAARRVARGALGTPPAWLEQSGAFGDKRRHPGGAEVSVSFVALVPSDASVPEASEAAWFSLADLPALPPRQRAMTEAAFDAIRLRLDQAPVAFRLLPPTFTLSELQEIYELLLGRRLHKASFRRALQSAWLVEPTDEWRSEGRGRPAQLFRYAPRRRRGNRRGVRFDLLIG